MKKNFLLIILAVSLLTRGVFLFFPGFQADVNCFIYWANWINNDGFFNLYGPNFFNHVDYPPLIPLIIAWWFKLFSYVRFDSYYLFKSLVFCTDVFVVVYLYLNVQREKLRGFLAAAVILSIPIAINGSLWGQVDNIAFVFAILSFYFLTKKRNYLSLFVLALGILAKPHLMFFGPVYAIYFFKQKKQKTFLPIVVVVLLVLSIFLLFHHYSGANLLDSFTKVVGRYKSTSLNAYNFWWIIYGRDTWFVEDTLKIGFLTYRNISILVFVATIIPVLYKAIKEKIISQKIFLYNSLVYMLFFMILTEMHERYLFLSFAFLTVYVIFNKTYRFLYYAVSVTFGLNLILVLFEVYPQAGIALTQSLIKPSSLVISIFNVLILIIFYIKVMRERSENAKSNT